MSRNRKKSKYEKEDMDDRIIWIISKLERASDTAIEIVCQFIRGLIRD